MGVTGLARRSLEHDLVQVVAGLPVVSVHRHRRRRSTRRAAGAAEGAGIYQSIFERNVYISLRSSS
jgi:hypothetical protein